MTKALFTFQQDGIHERHTLLHNYEDKEHADKLVDEGKATYVDLGLYPQYETNAQQLHDRFNADVRRVRDNDNPIMTEAVKKYEIDKLEQQYTEDSEKVITDYAEYRTDLIEQAKTRAAQAVIKVTDDDKSLAEQFSTRAALTLATTTDKGLALLRIRKDIGLLTDSQKVALQSNVVGLLESVDDELGKRAIYEAVQDVRNQDLLSLKIAEQLPRNPAIAYAQRRLLKGIANKDINQGGISPQFYQDHLKVGRK